MTAWPGWMTVAIVLAGCYGPTVAQDVPCGPEGQCPAGQTCDHDGRCRSDPRALDSDGDGVADELDNCVAIANPQQYDEDGDTVGNECDNCPHVPNVDQAATEDDDDAGDACDGNSTVHQILLVFEGFDERPADWTIPDSWRIAGGQLVADARTTAGIATWSSSTPDAVIVQAGGRMMQNDGGHAAVIARASGDAFYRCAVTPRRGELVRHQAGTVTTMGTGDLGAVDLSDIEVAIGVAAENVLCVMRAGALQQAIIATDPVPLGGSSIGVRASGADVRFAYFVAYALQ